ncbi:MAG: hypothetical protein LC785_15200 [Acidobacteria bacterium]|nr:hypothetical protein [Acidobacteriota bacterium]
MSIPTSNFNATLNRIEAEASERATEERRRKKVEEIRKQDAERARVRAAEREQEAQEHVAEIKERYRKLMLSTMPEQMFNAWWIDNRLRILEEEARQRDAAIASGSVGTGYGVM